MEGRIFKNAKKENKLVETLQWCWFKLTTCIRKASKKSVKERHLRVREPSSWVAERSLSSLNSSFKSSSEPTFPVAIKKQQTFC